MIKITQFDTDDIETKLIMDVSKKRIALFRVDTLTTSVIIKLDRCRKDQYRRGYLVCGYLVFDEIVV